MLHHLNETKLNSTPRQTFMDEESDKVRPYESLRTSGPTQTVGTEPGHTISPFEGGHGRVDLPPPQTPSGVKTYEGLKG